jgi:zinc protease
VPANASIAIVGDVDPEQALALARKYFGWMPKAKVERPPAPAQVTLAKTDRVDLEDQVELPKVTLAWPSPKDGSEGDAAADLLSHILAGGKASRLFEQLVHQKAIATDVAAYEGSQALQSSFAIEVMGRPNSSPDALIKAVDGVLEDLFAHGITQAELDAAREDLYTSTARSLEGLVARGEVLNHLQQRDGDASGLARDLARYDRLTPKTFLEQVKAFLDKPRVELVVLPAAAANPQGAKESSR